MTYIDVSIFVPNFHDNEPDPEHLWNHAAISEDHGRVRKATGRVSRSK